MTHRLNLISDNDLRPIARATQEPVFALAGFWDPIVPRLLTKYWLNRNCPGFTESKMIFTADHNVLGTAPAEASKVVLMWMREGKERGGETRPEAAQPKRYLPGSSPRVTAIRSQCPQPNVTIAD